MLESSGRRDGVVLPSAAPPRSGPIAAGRSILTPAARRGRQFRTILSCLDGSVDIALDQSNLMCRTGLEVAQFARPGRWGTFAAKCPVDAPHRKDRSGWGSRLTFVDAINICRVAAGRFACFRVVSRTQVPRLRRSASFLRRVRFPAAPQEGPQLSGPFSFGNMLYVKLAVKMSGVFCRFMARCVSALCRARSAIRRSSSANWR